MTETINKTETNTKGSVCGSSCRTFAPGVDIFELPDQLVLQADVPGAKVENLNINFERGVLTIHAHVEPRREAQADFLLREFGVGDFHRAFRIGEGIDANGIAAEMNNGVLTLHLPKAAAARTRKIDVKTANG